MSATSEGWVELPTGASDSTNHSVGPMTVEITELDTAETMAELVEGPDPFDLLDSP